MPTIGKTSEGNHISLNMRETSAHSGRQKILFRRMLTDASTNIDVNILMAGKNKSITLLTIRYILVELVKAAPSLTVHTITMNLTEDNLLISTSSYSPKTEAAQYILTKSISHCILISCLMFQAEQAKHLLIKSLECSN